LKAIETQIGQNNKAFGLKLSSILGRS